MVSKCDFRLPDGKQFGKLEELLCFEGWQECLSCSAPVSTSQSQCEQCQVFKPLEVYPNILSNPEQVTSVELDALRKRRKLEK